MTECAPAAYYGNIARLNEIIHVSRCGHLAHTLLYLRDDNILSSAPTPTSSSTRISFTVVRRLAWMSSSRCPEHGLSLTSVATPESTNPSPNRADINCLGSVNVHQAPVNVDWFNFFYVEESNDASLLLTLVHDRGCFLDCHTVNICNREMKISGYEREGSVIVS